MTPERIAEHRKLAEQYCRSVDEPLVADAIEELCDACEALQLKSAQLMAWAIKSDEANDALRAENERLKYGPGVMSQLVDAGMLRLTTERDALRAENEKIRQVASFNEERAALITAKYRGQPYDDVRLKVLQEAVSAVFNPNEAILGLEILQLRARLAEAVKLLSVYALVDKEYPPLFPKDVAAFLSKVPR